MNSSNISQPKKNSVKTASLVFLLVTLASLLMFSTALQAMEKKSQKESAGNVVAVSDKETPDSRPVMTEKTFHGNVKSRIFHRHGCRNFNCGNCTAVFKSRDKAVGAGYTPCNSCKP